MSDATAAVVTSWAAEWAAEFDQGLDDQYMQTLVGLRIQGTHAPRDAEGNLTAVPRRFVRNIIGYSKMVVYVKGADDEDTKEVVRWGLIDDEGKMLSIYSGMELGIADNDAEEEG